MSRSSRALLLLFVALLAPACASFNKPFRSVRTPAHVPGAIERARAELEAGRTRVALERLREAREVRALPTEVRHELETMLEAVAVRRIAELSESGKRPSELARMIDLGLPQQVAVSAGLTAAEQYLGRGRRMKAFRIVQKLETRYPTHYGRMRAGAILYEAGMSMIEDGWSILGFFRTADKGAEVLEYMVLTYPSEPRCDQAYRRLAKHYEDDRLLTKALDRHEELLLWHADSPLAIESEADIPRLRLASLESPEYDRNELLKARFELEVWLDKHAGHPREERVRYDLDDCLRRLVASDLVIARFYRRIEEPYGARLHAGRALQTARNAGLAQLARQATELLSTLPIAADLPVTEGEPEPAVEAGT